MIAHWDEAPNDRAEVGHLGAVWSNLGVAAETKTVGVNRIQIDPGKWSTPYHRQTGEEEIFYVLAGSGVCLQDEGAFAVSPGDCIVHRLRQTHALRAGDDGLDVLAVGTRARTEIGHLPRAGVAWIGGTWADVGGGDHPWKREVDAGEPEVSELGERPANVVNCDDVEGVADGRWKRLASVAGSELAGLNWGRLNPGDEGAPPHSHSADEEILSCSRATASSSSGPIRSRPAAAVSTRNTRSGPGVSSRDRPGLGSPTDSEAAGRA